MSSFFEHMPFDGAQHLEQLSRLAFDLRESAKQLLQQHGADTPQALLERIRAGVVPAHPGYEHYLSACIVARTRDAVRQQLAACAAEIAG